MRPYPPRAGWRTYRLLFSSGFAALLLLLLAVALFGLSLLNGVRAYVTGEGLWSKAQKDAVSYLRRYAFSRSQSDYQHFLSELSIPLADHDARVELQNSHPDLTAAAEHFISGRNPPDDAIAMARMFHYLRSESHVRQAVAIWTEGDRYIEQLGVCGLSLHQALSTGSADSARVNQLLAEIESVNDHLTPLENEFSRTLGEGSRFAQTTLLIALCALTVMLIAIGVLITGQLLRRIREAEAQARKFFASASDGLFIADQRTGIILEANPSAEAMAGMTTQQLEGKRFEEFVRPCRERTDLDGDAIWRAADGRELRVKVRSSAARIHDADVLVTIIRDVTEQRRLQERSAEATRLEALGRLANGIAHDFNNLLSAIELYASNSLESVRSSVTRQALEQILRASRKGADLIQQLVAFSGNQPLKTQVFDTNDGIRNVVPMLDRLLNPEIQLVTILAPVRLLVKADRSQFEQVIVTLATNAGDGMPGGGLLTIETCEVTDKNVVEMGRPAPFGSGVLLRVSNQGSGMATEFDGCSFFPFFTTKPLDRATRPGLSSVFDIVGQSDGDIWVSCAPGSGSTVWVLLPMAQDENLR